MRRVAEVRRVGGRRQPTGDHVRVPFRVRAARKPPVVLRGGVLRPAAVLVSRTAPEGAPHRSFLEDDLEIADAQRLTVAIVFPAVRVRLVDDFLARRGSSRRKLCVQKRPKSVEKQAQNSHRTATNKSKIAPMPSSPCRRRAETAAPPCRRRPSRGHGLR